MDLEKYKKAGIELIYSDFDDEKDLTGNKLSILDYIMNHGYKIPKEWNWYGRRIKFWSICS